ncbi:MAG: DUF342 domain-containing protein [Bacillus sp. (in: firmicutes)]
MEEFFEVRVSKDMLTASIYVKETLPEDFTATSDQLDRLMGANRIVFGLLYDQIERMVADPTGITYPVVIAKGEPSIKGEDGYLVNRTIEEMGPNSQVESDKPLNFRHTSKILSVESGQLIASIVPEKLGTPGRDVFGDLIQAKDGKPFRLKAGKNVLILGGDVYATIDGQISVGTDIIHVLPVYEVNGDLDLMTGNIDFIGNVIIHGNVPNDFEITAGGDIQVFGLVEAATLSAGGSIVISGGIAGATKGSVVADGDVLASYLNQANVKAGRSVNVETTILHSRVEAEAIVICRKGHIIGGEVWAHKGIEAQDFGNQHYMKTILCVGGLQTYTQTQAHLRTELHSVQKSLDKIRLVGNKLKRKEEMVDGLSTKDKILKSKQAATEKSLSKSLIAIEAELERLSNEQGEAEDYYLKANGKVYPNTYISIGNCQKHVPEMLKRARFYLSAGNIVSASSEQYSKVR